MKQLCRNSDVTVQLSLTLVR